MGRAVVFVHGMFMTPSCWSGWRARWEAAGHTCHAPAWPLRDRSVAELRAAHPDPALGKLTLDDVVARYEEFLRPMDERPILVGHSMGGLIVQILLQRGFGSAGVAVDSAPPRGVFAASWSFLKANFPMLGSPFVGTPRLLTFEEFRYAFAEILPEDLVREVYEREVVPESRRVPRSSLGKIGAIDFDKPKPPLLLIAGERDNIIPPILNRKNHAAYQPTAGLADFKEFAGRTHFILGQEGWEEVSDYAMKWVADRVP